MAPNANDSVRFKGSLEDFTKIDFKNDESSVHFKEQDKGVDELLDEFDGDYFYEISLWRARLIPVELKEKYANDYSKIIELQKGIILDECVSTALLINDGDCARIGRGPDNEIKPKSIYVSRKHCMALLKETEEGRKLFYRDVGTFRDGSKNGTFINGYENQRVPFPDFSKPPFRWNNDDDLTFGNKVILRSYTPEEGHRYVNEFSLRYQKIKNPKK